jgi:hypothetical protein
LPALGQDGLYGLAPFGPERDSLKIIVVADQDGIQSSGGELHAQAFQFGQSVSTWHHDL